MESGLSLTQACAALLIEILELEVSILSLSSGLCQTFFLQRINLAFLEPTEKKKVSDAESLFLKNHITSKMVKNQQVPLYVFILLYLDVSPVHIAGP